MARAALCYGRTMVQTLGLDDADAASMLTKLRAPRGWMLKPAVVTYTHPSAATA
jgi:hypothetical protein